ncbi:MAG: outer membrane beta-barrel protein [Bacteroidales bacterium]|nr:outer membrane beta-barrel protein [Bacteroidales bacterium]
MKQDWTDTLKQKMAGYEERPSDELWAALSERAGLQESRRKVIPVWFWGLSAAAALMAGIFVVTKVNDKSVNDLGGITADVAVSEPVDAEESEPIDTAVPEPVERTLAEDLAEVKAAESVSLADVAAGRKQEAAKVGIKQMVKARKAKSALIAEAVPVESRVGAVAEDVTSVNTEEYAAEVPSENHDAREAETVESDTVEQSEPAMSWDEYLKETPSEKARAKRSGGFSAGILAGGAVGGNTSGSKPTAMVMGANPLAAGVTKTDWIDKDSKVSAIVYNQPEVQEEYSHKIPVKVGLTARYNITGRLGVETGLTYSILSSSVKTGNSETGKNWSTGSQTLHYLGIPLNISFNILNSRYVNIYLTGGGMMEKSISGNIKTDEYVDGKFARTLTAKISPKGLQWSLNAAAGVQANILPQLGFFVEPGISHHFKNGSRVRSIYTDKPTDFSLGFGLRYSFGK